MSSNKTWGETIDEGVETVKETLGIKPQPSDKAKQGAQSMKEGAKDIAKGAEQKMDQSTK